MKFENKGLWFKESEDTDYIEPKEENILEDDELDTVEDELDSPENEELAIADEAKKTLKDFGYKPGDTFIVKDLPRFAKGHKVEIVTDAYFNNYIQDYAVDCHDLTAGKFFGVRLDWLPKNESSQKNEVRYIDPDNLDKYDPNELEEVTTKSGEKRYKRKSSGSTNKPVEKKEPEEDSAEDGDDFYSDNYEELNDIPYEEDPDKLDDPYRVMTYDGSERFVDKDTYDRYRNYFNFTDQKQKAKRYAKQLGGINYYRKSDRSPEDTAQYMYDVVNNDLGEDSWDDLMADAEHSRLGSSGFDEKSFKTKWYNKLGENFYKDFKNLYSRGFFN